ncbi:sulfotransferase [Enterovibrio paralichthyis]|uniref:sulfotransferase n=1 Tax=Enterovibrio paralichthyis TaxID=2853805 RepID=UPI001C4893B1|nr:sulfotransferase [Enterovibrio paralichthyis]MBV7297112.1 sulfotransferase [Enterovibrio paralichthyis]
MSHQATLSQPLIFVGPPRSGVTLISDIVFHHNALCWLDENFEKHPRSDFQHRLFKRASSWRSNAYKRSPLLGALSREFSPAPTEAINFWDDITREEIDFHRGFLRGKHATPAEIAAIKETLARRVDLSGKSKLSLRFTGPSRLCFLHSIFPDARFVHVVRDPASTVHSMISTEEWEYLGKHLLWWRGAYSLQELAMYDQLRHHAVAGTAFQLNKLIQTTKLEADELGIDLLTVNYEDFVASPQMVMARILDHARLAPDASVEAALSHNDIRCSNKVLKMPATDINTVYTWCPAS